jgi:hypothetical protein
LVTPPSAGRIIPKYAVLCQILINTDNVNQQADFHSSKKQQLQHGINEYALYLKGLLSVEGVFGLFGVNDLGGCPEITYR